eukprot:5137856-Ditylum_brightwellii.AAC.1
MKHICILAWYPNKHLSCYEHTTSFKGQHVDKLRINCKKVVDIFQADALCYDGYTYAFYFCNAPALQKYLMQGMLSASQEGTSP